MTEKNIKVNDIKKLFQRYRPAFHFLPEANWMNDPNGPIYYNGEYHLFYQYNPNGSFHGTIHWGHAISKDLLNWSHLPVALAPDQSYDKEGIYSGCALIHDGVPTILYTGIFRRNDEGGYREVQCLATSSDMINWEKSEANPIIEEPPVEYETTGWRDPFVWQEGDCWYMLIGSGIKDRGGMPLLYRSMDLKNWEYMHPLFIGEDEPVPDMWECPNFFKLDDKYVLIISSYGKVYYWVGDYQQYRFIPEKRGFVDLGKDGYYAPNSFMDDQGRRIMWGWLMEQTPRELQKDTGWAGVMSLPREVYLKDGDLAMRPVQEVKNLRAQNYNYDGLEVNAEEGISLDAATGNKIEIEAIIDRFDAGVIGFRVLASPDQEEYTEIILDKFDNSLWIDTRNSSKLEEAQRAVYGDNITISVRNKMKINIFIDNSTIEVFLNDQITVTARVYPLKGDSKGIELFTRYGSVEFKSFNIWEMNSV